jgi:hypothetical protein
MAQGLESCSVWIDRSVGRNFHANANATGRAFDIAFWMSDEHPFTSVADWNNVYKAHVDKLKACCTAGPGGAECKAQVPKIRTAALPGLNPGATISASIDGGATYPYVAVSPTDGPPAPIGSGASLGLRWESDVNLSTCAIEATLPVGVTASGGPGPVSTGTNWNLDDSPQTVGPLSSPGLYNFVINCNQRVHAGLTFQVAGSPAPLIQIQAMVNSTAGPLASAPGGTAATVVGAQLLDTINLAWSADNVQPGSCKVTEMFDPPGAPTGRTFMADSGFQELEVQASTAQTYSLACKAADGTTDLTAQTTVHLPGLGLVCDINGDGKVDQSDISLIFNATGPAKPFSDPRDVDRDGVITVNDARFCATKCTKAGCVP